MEQSILQNTAILWLLLAWILPWKGVALWRAANNHNLKWFVVMLVLNTLAILPIIYIFYFSKKKPKEIENTKHEL